MTKHKNNASERILDVAQSLILQRGYSATSIEEIIESAHITKGGFFYHFKGKNEMALALVQRYLEQDDLFFDDLFQRAEDLSEDPLQRMLIFLKLLAEAMGDLPNGHPGCLVASYIYESLQFESDVLELVTQGVLGWRHLFQTRLEAVIKSHPMKLEVSAVDLADMLSSIIEGAIVTSLALKNPKILSDQLLQYRNYLRLLFDAA